MKVRVYLLMLLFLTSCGHGQQPQKSKPSPSAPALIWPQPNPFQPNPFRFDSPVTTPFHPFDDDPYELDKMFKLPDSEFGSPKWFDELPSIPPCQRPWDIWEEPSCLRVSNYI